MTHLTDMMEQFSLAYVRAVIAAAGCVASDPSTDTDSIDLSVKARKEPDFPMRPQLDLQLKSTFTIEEVGETIPYALKVKNFDELRETTSVPRLLVLVLIPKDFDQWSTHDPTGLILRRCGYWMDLEGAGPKDNEHTVTVHIPSKNLFGPTQLREILKDRQRKWSR
jgi:hypothetical protein